MYLQALLSQALRALGHAREAENSIHFSYEMVALSHATARELGYETEASSEEAQKAVRRGVRPQGPRREGRRPARSADDKASAEVARRNPEFSAEECRRVGRRSPSAAIRYFMLKYSRGKLIVFDIEEALSFEGETGPYLQYAVVRANNIFHKLQRAGGPDRQRTSSPRSTARAADELTDDGERPVGAGARGGAARRNGGSGRPIARILGAGEVRLRPRAAVQCVLSSVSDPQRRRRSSGNAGARPGWRTSARR